MYRDHLTGKQGGTDDFQSLVLGTLWSNRTAEQSSAFNLE
jgi:hypothetical protein